MFGIGHEDHEIAELTAHIEPYRNIVVAYETDQRLQSMDIELLTQGRHVVTSNDRYQFSSAYLVLARNRAMLSDAIAKKITGTTVNQDDLLCASFDYDTVGDFLLQGFQASTDSLEASDRIKTIKGYKATTQDTAVLKGTLNGLNWLRPEQISRNFLGGALEGLRAVSISTHGQYVAMNKNSAVQNSMKFRLRQHVDPLLATLDTKLQSIDRITKGRVDTVSSPQVLADLYKDVVGACAAADQAGLWLTIPKLFDTTFTLSNPLDELRPPERKFDTTALGAPAVVHTTPPPKPSGPAKPFDPNALAAPSTPKPGPDSPAKSFDPSILSSPVNTPASSPKKNFDPDVLQDGPKHFDPSDIGHAALQTPETGNESPKPATQHKSFNPDDLK